MGMFETLRDAAKIGMGAVSLSKENFKKVTDELAEMGKVSKEEGERLFNEFDKSRDDYSQKLNETIETTVKKALDTAGLATRAEVDELRERLSKLEPDVAAEPAADPTDGGDDEGGSVGNGDA